MHLVQKCKDRGLGADIIKTREYHMVKMTDCENDHNRRTENDFTETIVQTNTDH